MSAGAAKNARAVTGRGRCLCGAVRYTVYGALRERISACHCHMCRRHIGGVGYWTSVDEADDIEIDGGTALRWYQSSPGNYRGFCQNCGSSLFIREDNRTVIDIVAGTLDDGPDFKMSQHIFVASKGDYYEIEDNLPRYAESRPGS